MDRVGYLEKIADSKGKEQINNILQYAKYLQQIEADESIRQSKRALKLCRELGFGQWEIYCLFHLGYAYYYNQDLNQAESIADEVLKLSESLGNKEDEVEFKINYPYKKITSKGERSVI